MKFLVSNSRMVHLRAILLGLVFFLFCPLLTFSEEPVESAITSSDDQLEDELQYLQEETYVITPSRIPQRIEKAPGSIYVVTDQQIRQMGARYLSDVIETVPGWSLWQYYYFGDVALARGVAGDGANQILFMVNSQNVNNPRDGSGMWYQYMTLDNVKRIEFVTGAGSSLYGSGAMAGIVNVITKNGDDVDGLQITGRGGSYNTWEGNALFGKTIEGLEVAAYTDYLNTDGFQGHVDRDQQSVLDQKYGTHASLAPGNMKGDANQWDTQLTMKYKGFKFDGKYLGRNYDQPFGFRPILDNMSNLDFHQYYLNLSYDAKVMEGFDLLAKVYRSQYAEDGKWQGYPKGSLAGTPTGPTILSDNKYVNSKFKSRRTGAETQSTYQFTDANTLVGGITFEQTEVYDNSKEGNYFLTSTPGVIIPLSSVQYWPSNLVIPNKKRNIWAAYAEDLWDIMDNLRLTIGGRYDHYSDVGGQFSPRVGLNWNISQNYYTKFMYERAFRAPTFREMYEPYGGNPDLKPMTKDTYELTFGLRFLPSFNTQLTGFLYEPKNALAPVLVGTSGRWQYTNFDSNTKNRGVELQMKYDFGRGTYLSMSYTYIDLELRGPNGQRLSHYYMPSQLGTLNANIRLNRYLNLNAYLLYRGGWERMINDPREDPGDYAVVNATLIARNFLKELKGLEVRAAVKNLLNKAYTSPTAAGYLPDDMPMPGINFFLELRYTF